MYKQISENEFNKLLNSYEQVGTYQKKKTMVTELEKKPFLKSKMTYDMWLRRYKDRTVNDIDVNEHTKWSKEFQAWRVGNIEKL